MESIPEKKDNEDRIEEIVEKKLDEKLGRNERSSDEREDEISRRSFLKKLGYGVGLGTLTLLPSASALDFRGSSMNLMESSGASPYFEVDSSGNTYADGAIYANGSNEVWTEGNDGPLLRSFNLNLSSHKLNSGEYTAMHRFTVPSGRSLEVFSVSVANNSHNQPSGLNLVIRNTTSGSNTATYSTAYNDGDPLDSFAVGGDDILIGVDNGHHTSGTGSMQVVNAHIKLRVQ